MRKALGAEHCERRQRGFRLLFLIVDDDELSREVLAMLLGIEGHEAEAAASGEEALARLSAPEQPVPDVILSDMQMPGLSGEALALALRTAAGGKARLFAMSGSQPAETALRAFDGFLLKPFSMGDLDALIAQTLVRPREGADMAARVIDAGEDFCDTDADVPGLNEDVYAKMAQMMPPLQLGELYAMCLGDARKRISQMGYLAETGEDEDFRKAAHTVKGGCGMIGATELYRLAELAERDGLSCGPAAEPGREVGTSGVTTLLGRFSSACDRLERILEERR